MCENIWFCPHAWLIWYRYLDSKLCFPENFVSVSSDIQNGCQAWWHLESFSFLGNLIWSLVALEIFSVSSEVSEIPDQDMACCLSFFFILFSSWFALPIWRPVSFFWSGEFSFTVFSPLLSQFSSETPVKQTLDVFHILILLSHFLALSYFVLFSWVSPWPFFLSLFIKFLFSFIMIFNVLKLSFSLIASLMFPHFYFMGTMCSQIP